jgi:hypothetical protein
MDAIVTGAHRAISHDGFHERFQYHARVFLQMMGLNGGPIAAFLDAAFENRTREALIIGYWGVFRY